jgi:hypothetical protein
MEKIVLEVTEHELVLMGVALQQLSKNALSTNLKKDANDLELKLGRV